MTHRLFAFWTGDNPLNTNRQRGWDTFGVTGLDPVLVTSETLESWLVPGAPLHPAYQHLSLVHRSDYLRPYFMYHHGGGYADIKPQSGSWVPTVDKVHASSRLFGAGYREVRGGTVRLQNAPINDRHLVLTRRVPRFVAAGMTDVLRITRPSLIGNCAYYFKAKTPFARRWLTNVEMRLDSVMDVLTTVGQPDPRARLGDENGYPLPWTSIHGDILHPLALRYALHLDRGLPRPSFSDYL